MVLIRTEQGFQRLHMRQIAAINVAIVAVANPAIPAMNSYVPDGGTEV
jgi:hypothetical protein